jgi:hypothetical protein
MFPISPRPLYTLSFRLPRQTLWDIPRPLLPLPRCSLFACHLSVARSALLLRGTTERNRSSYGRRIEGTCSCFHAWLRGDVLPRNFLFRPVSDSSSPSSCGTSDVSLSGSPRLPRKSCFRWSWA